MVKELLEIGGERFVIPIVVVAIGVTLVKGLFGLHRSRSSNRRDFLDVFRGWDGQCDLWLSTAVRHISGAYLPPALIRQLMSGPQPGRALLEVSSAWGFLDMDDETQEMRWRRKALAKPAFRKGLGWFLTVLYFLLASFALLLAYRTIASDSAKEATFIAWAYVTLSAFGAIVCLAYQENLSAASKAANRWLGLS